MANPVVAAFFCRNALDHGIADTQVIFYMLFAAAGRTVTCRTNLIIAAICDGFTVRFCILDAFIAFDVRILRTRFAFGIRADFVAGALLAV